MPPARFQLYNPSSIATTFVSSEKHTVEARRAGARAVLRHGLHTANHLATHSSGGLHPLYMGVHGLGGQNKLELKELDDLMKDSLYDAFDSISTLDLIDGAISLLLHCPGSKIPTKFSVEDITVDVYISPRELLEGGIELSRGIALIVQKFGEIIALPHLQRFQLRCTQEGIKAPPAPLPGALWNQSSEKLYLPSPATKNGPYIRCKCRPASSSNVTQDKFAPPSSQNTGNISQANTARCKCRPTSNVTQDVAPLRSSQNTRNTSQGNTPQGNTPQGLGDTSQSSIDIPISEEWIHEASLIARQYDEPVQSSSVQTKPKRVAQHPIREEPKHTAPRQNKDDGFQGALVSIGLHTDSVLDRFNLDDHLIPRLRTLMQTVRSSRWEATLRSPDFGLSYEQACKLSEAMLKDIGGIPNAVAKSSPTIGRSPVFLVLLTAVATVLAAFIVALYI